MSDQPSIRIGLLGIAGLLGMAGPVLAADIQVRFELDLDAGKPIAPARIVVGQSAGELREIVLDASRLQKVSGDGQVTVDDDRVRWLPPATGGALRYRVALSHRRAGRRSPGNDAWVGDRFALFRGDDAFPIRKWRRAKGSTLSGELGIDVPKDWALITPYRPDHLLRMPIHNPGHRLPRPIGWITAGDLGTRRDIIAGIEVTVSAPRGLRMERIAMLALLRWTLPQLVPALLASNRPPHYINIVSAAEPMWLGALSAPNSIYVHAQRPLISENGTSTIVHEMVHVLLSDLRTPRDEDWIDEGLAEFLSLRALKDSGTISEARYDATIAEFGRWGSAVTSLRGSSAGGPVTARAVTVFQALDAELRAASNGKQSVSMLVGRLLKSSRSIDTSSLRTAAQAIIGKSARSLAPAALPGLD